MFGWFNKKTDLEAFCGALTLENAAVQLEGSKNEDGFSRSLALLLLHTSHHFWHSLTESRELKNYVRKTSADVVMFETLVYVWSNLSLEMGRTLEDAELDEDDPLSDAVTDSLHISMAFFMKYLPDFEPQSVLRARFYPRDGLKSMEKYLGHLRSSFGQQLPSAHIHGNDEFSTELATQLHLMAHVGPFTTAYLPGVTEVMNHMATLVLEGRE